MSDEDDWWRLALCAEVDPELFFPEVGYYAQAQVAKAICRRCEVQVECLSYAIEADVEGIWGGTIKAERDRLRRRSA